MKAMATRLHATTSAVAAFLLLFGMTVLIPGPAAHAAGKPPSNGVVYLLRGGLNVFSTGLDVLAKELRGRGVDAKSYAFDDRSALAADAQARYVKTHLPIVIIGHSYGANAAVLMAAELEKSKTPVALLILFDTVSSMKVSANVRHVIDLVSTAGRGIDITVTAESGFTGRIDTIDVPEGHMSMDNDPRNHDLSIAAILKVIHRRIPRGNAQ
jgi:pimeloyl-ACP methyl ester carboxylesterase